LHTFADAEVLEHNLGVLRGHCADAGRDAAEIEVSVGIVISAAKEVTDNGPESIVARAENIAEALAAWLDEGVAEVMCRMEPPSAGMAHEIVRGTELFRAGAGTAVS
jgi:alkanesulfonate monooxygenase SsuD/methylene tetrahydromethanopterin reductase-like flavin-dependent oxidoreductase (luciferase family)